MAIKKGSTTKEERVMGQVTVTGPVKQPASRIKTIDALDLFEHIYGRLIQLPGLGPEEARFAADIAMMITKMWAGDGPIDVTWKSMEER